MNEAATPYPGELVRRHCLLDGREVTVRPIRPQDKQIEQDFVRGLSSETRYYRFMEHLRELSPKKLRHFTEIDYDRHLALIAVVPDDGGEAEVGVARYVSEPGTTICEFAIVIDDAWRRTGLAGVLMADLIEAARKRGFRTMEGTVLSDNHKMLKFARQLGFRIQPEPGDPQTRRIVLDL
ncbi:MAG TPA: GNAT family N-acetyltransferase [Burkholderiales bacterium]|nr:GNAT family N-acetyltransferase [Burkholderiales bacterium]